MSARHDLPRPEASGPARSDREVRVLAGLDELARVAGDAVVARAREAIAERGSFHVALAGGSTPRATYAALARRPAEADFERWHVWFGDERCVPPDSPESNHRMAAESGLLARVPEARVHRLRGEAPDPRGEAERYERELCAALGIPPRLDLVLLGLGADGHTASLFPGTAALAAGGWLTVGHSPKPPRERLTLTFPTLAEARSVVFLVSGSDKRPALERILRTPGEDLPARRVRPRDGGLLWLVERSAAPPSILSRDAPGSR